MFARLLVVVCLLVVVGSSVSYGEVWNVGDDFSPYANPGGQWSYGWRYQPSNPMVLYVLRADSVWSGCSLDTWYYSVPEWNPCVMHNPHDYTVICSGTVVVPPNAVDFHPGADKQCVIRWTAPHDAQIALTTEFTAVDIGTSLVHVYRNGVEIFVATLSGLGDSANFASTFPVHLGDVVDCAVDPISFVYDTLRVDITLESTEPVPAKEATWGQVKMRFR